MSKKHVQVLLYTSYLHIIGGIETFVYNFIELMSEDYEIGLVCPRIPDETYRRIATKVPVFRDSVPLSCDTLIMIRMMDAKPDYVTCKKSIRMCHACKTDPSWRVVEDCDRIIHVSRASKQSFDDGGQVIYNPLMKTDKMSLLLTSATRIPAQDKGENAQRMLKLAQKLNTAGIPFIWLNFSDQPLTGAPKGFINVGTRQDIQPYIAKADYLVQLSDQEGFGYSVLEALINRTAVLCTPFETTKELKVVDGKNGYIIPFDLDFDVHKLLKVPVFDYEYDNEAIKKKWTRILNAKPRRKTQNGERVVRCRVTVPYTDIELKKHLNYNQYVEMRISRALTIEERGYLTIVEELDHGNE